MEKILRLFFRTHATLINISFLLLLNAVMILVIIPEASQGVIMGTEQSELIDRFFFFTSADFYPVISGYGDTGRTNYVFMLLTADIVFSILYSVLLVFLAVVFYEKLNFTSLKKWIFFPLIFPVIEGLENVLLIFLLVSYPVKHPLLANFLGGSIMLKWCMLFSFLLVFFSGALLTFIKYVKKKAT